MKTTNKKGATAKVAVASTTETKVPTFTEKVVPQLSEAMPETAKTATAQRQFIDKWLKLKGYTSAAVTGKMQAKVIEQAQGKVPAQADINWEEFLNAFVLLVQRF